MNYHKLVEWLGFKGRPKAVRKPAGHTITTGPFGEVVHADTLQCCHCSGHFEVIVGSGKERGWCSRCSGYVCGEPLCMAACVPFEKKLENIEAGLPILTPTPNQVVVPNTEQIKELSKQTPQKSAE